MYFLKAPVIIYTITVSLGLLTAATDDTPSSEITILSAAASSSSASVLRTPTPTGENQPVTNPIIEQAQSTDRNAFTNPQSNTSDNNNNDDDIHTVLLGNNKVIFSTPRLEYYTKLSASFWIIMNLFLDDLEMLTHGLATAFIAYSGTTNGLNQSHITSLAIQIGLIGNALHRIHVFSEQVMPLRRKQAAEYEKKNKELYDEENQLQLTQPANPDDIENNDDYYSPKLVVDFYSGCAVFKNIIWDHIGLYVILLQASSYSILNWSLTVNEAEKKELILIATFMSIASTFGQYFVKNIAKSTPKLEQMALSARNHHLKKKS